MHGHGAACARGVTASDTPSNRLRRIARRAMLQRGLSPEFSAAALAEANADPPAVAQDSSVRDLSDLLWCSIDNDDSRDLDQLSVAQPAADGAVKILIAIADVDATVKPHSAVDAHAQANTTSVYTAAQIFPMLPERLSTDVTSLGEGEDRLSVVIDMLVAPDGIVKTSDIYRATVRNRAKLAYNGVATWLDGAAPMPAAASAVSGMDEQLRIQDRVAQAMKQLRHAHGALTLETIETRAVFDGDLLTDLRPEEKNRAKDLIEDFMIAANTATAQLLERSGSPSVRRVLRAPKRWDRIVTFAASLGERLPEQPSAVALQQFLVKRRQADPERFADVSLTVIKLLGSGEYVLERPGERPTEHFGLAVRDYTHSTAPNRRFPDLLTQRLVKAALAGEPPPYGDDDLAALAAHCTEQEDNAAKVERQVRKSAAALLLASRVGEQFEAIVTGASPKGTWVRIANPAAEGRVVRGAEGLDVGDRVRVQLVSTDVERGFIDFVHIGER
jgi:VacB/RNase II family 3'-5' exoribonuclease